MRLSATTLVGILSLPITYSAYIHASSHGAVTRPLDVKLPRRADQDKLPIAPDVVIALR